MNPRSRSNLLMSLKRLTVAVLLGLLTYAVVLYWPASPRWVVNDSQGPLVIGPCFDGNILFVWQGGRDVVARSMKGGTELWRFEVPPAEGGGRKLWPSEFKVIAEGKRLWVKYESGWITEAGNYPMRFAILDARTGARVHGPFALEGRNVSLSPDGQWMAAYRPGSGWSVYSTETGKAVGLRPPTDFIDTRAEASLFAPDSSSLAVPWGSRADVEAVGFYDPASGRLVRHLVLPPNSTGWGKLVRWEGNTLLFQSSERTSQAIRDQGECFHGYSVDIVGDRFGRPRHEEALEGLSQYSANDWNTITPLLVGDRIVREIQGRQVRANDLWWQIRNLCDEWFNTKWAPRVPEEVLIQILTRDAKRVCFSVRSRKERYYVSPDARWVATVDDEGLALWDADPWPRWPWAVGAGMATWAVVMFVRRRRRSSSPPINGPSGRREESLGVV